MKISCFVLSDYIESALAKAKYEKIEDGTFVGRIPTCKGVIAFGPTLSQCEKELHSVLEDWILVGIKLNHRLPVMGGINLNKEPRREPMAVL